MGKNRLDLSAFDLKLLAMAAMLADHIGYLFFPQALWMRCVGRLAFPTALPVQFVAGVAECQTAFPDALAGIRGGCHGRVAGRENAAETGPINGELHEFDLLLNSMKP